MRPQDPELSALLDRFVLVRIVDMKGVDLNRFRFDYDLTFAVLMMDAEGATYSRFGSRDGSDPAGRMSIGGLKRAMREVLERHRARQAPAVAPESKPFTIADYPGFSGTRAAGQACYHCHYANDARFAQLRLEGKFSKELLFQYPLPENLGLVLDRDRSNVASSVKPDSPAAMAGIQTGDSIVRADRTPVVTSADLQFALNDLPDPGTVTLRVAGKSGVERDVSLKLPPGWRRTDISWRASQGAIPPIIGIWEEPLTDAQRSARKIPPGALALRVSFLFPGDRWVRTRGDLRLNDVIVGVNGKDLPHMTARQFHSYFRLNFNVGDSATLNVLRGEQRLDIPIPCLDVGED